MIDEKSKGVNMAWTWHSSVIKNTYGKGNFVSAIFLAFRRATKPRESVWNVRDMTGGGTEITPSAMALVMTVRNMCVIKNTLSKPYSSPALFMCLRVSASRPQMSMMEKPWLCSCKAISSNAKPWAKLMRRTIVARKIFTSSAFDAMAPLEKLQRQLIVSYHSPRIWCSRVVPSQNRPNALFVRKTMRVVIVAVHAVHISRTSKSSTPALYRKSGNQRSSSTKINARQDDGTPNQHALRAFSSP